MATEKFVSYNFRGDGQKIVNTAVKICDDYRRQGLSLSLRQIYYQFVARDLLPNTEQSYKKLGDIVSNARLAGLLDWDMIKDRGRETVSNPHWDDQESFLRSVMSQYKTDTWRGQPNHVSVIVEKQALEGVLEPVCRRLDIEFTANKGYSSSSALYEMGKRLQKEFLGEGSLEDYEFEDILYNQEKTNLFDYESNSTYLPSEYEIEDLRNSEKYDDYEKADVLLKTEGRAYMRPHPDGGRALHVIYLGDHDPSGIDMTRDVKERLEQFSRCPINVHRAALNMDQIRRYNPPQNPAKLALALDTLLPTPNGWTTMGEVKEGDLLLGSDGKTYPVTGKSEIFENKPCLEMTLSGGQKIVCSEDHLWTVDARGRRSGTFPASHIFRKWREGKSQTAIYRIGVAKAMEGKETDLPIPPYVFGAWLGDGNSDAEGFACGLDDEEMLENIEAEGFRTRRKPSYPMAATIYGLRGKLYSLGVANNKHIPMTYLRSSYSQRLALLQGLMDTDGTVGRNRNMIPCSFGSSRKNLALQVLELLCTLGIRGKISESRAVFNGKDYGPTWRVEFYPGDQKIFRLTRKQSILTDSKVSGRQFWRVITDVKSVPTVPTQCLSIASPDHLYLAGEQFIATHNTDSRADEYVRKFGNASWELDALAPNVLASVVTDIVDSLRDDELYDSTQNQMFKEREELVAIADKYRNRLEETENEN